jgi:hypothetical protein
MNPRALTIRGRGFSPPLPRLFHFYLPTEFVPQTATLFTSAFPHDPVIIYVLSSLSPSARQAYLPTYFKSLPIQLALNNVNFTETNGFQACTVILRPGEKADNVWKMLIVGLVAWMERFLGSYGCVLEWE